MNYEKEYREKLRTAEQAVSVIASGDVVDYGSFNGKPVVCDRALAKRAHELRDVCIYSAVNVAPQPETSKHPESFNFMDWHWTKLTRSMSSQAIPSIPPCSSSASPST